MSATQPPQGGAPASGAGADPSMEDILASIRRILSDDEAEQAAAPPGGPAAAPAVVPASSAADIDAGVLALDASMIVEEEPVRALAPPAGKQQEQAIPNSIEPAAPPKADFLVAPEAAAAAASSVGTLLRTLITEREQIQVHRGGPTIEDLVREEIRPLLKAWLDANLPALAERLVRTEIERVVGRAAS